MIKTIKRINPINESRVLEKEFAYGQEALLGLKPLRNHIRVLRIGVLPGPA